MSSEKDATDPKPAGAPSAKEGSSTPPNPRSLPPPTAAIDDEWASESSGAAPEIPAPPKMPGVPRPAEPAPAAAAPEPAAPPPPEPAVEAVKAAAPPPPEPEPAPPPKAASASGPASPRSRAPSYLIAAIVVVLIAIWLGRPSRPPVREPSVAPAVSAVAAPAVSAVAAPAVSAVAEPSASAAAEPSASAAAEPSASAAAADAVSVVLNVVPDGAKVYYKGQLLGRAPMTIDLGKGERRELEVSSRGYVTRRLVLDGSKPEVTVRLLPEAHE